MYIVILLQFLLSHWLINTHHLSTQFANILIVIATLDRWEILRSHQNLMILREWNPSVMRMMNEQDNDVDANSNTPWFVVIPLDEFWKNHFFKGKFSNFHQVLLISNLISMGFLFVKSGIHSSSKDAKYRRRRERRERYRRIASSRAPVDRQSGQIGKPAEMRLNSSLSASSLFFVLSDQ